MLFSRRQTSLGKGGFRLFLSISLQTNTSTPFQNRHFHRLCINISCNNFTGKSPIHFNFFFQRIDTKKMGHTSDKRISQIYLHNSACVDLLKQKQKTFVSVKKRYVKETDILWKCLKFWSHVFLTNAHEGIVLLHIWI